MFSSTRRHVLLGFLALAAMVSLGTQANAKASGASQAAAAYEKGKGQLRGGKMVEALATFRAGLDAPETDQLETWQLLLGAALASEKSDRGADAIEYYRRFMDASEGAEKLLPPKWRERRQVVSDAVDELQRKLNQSHGYLTVSSTPSSAAIYVNGKRAGVDGAAKTPFGLFLLPGAYEIRVERGGHEPAISNVEIEVGKLKPLSMRLAEVVVEPPPAPPTPPPTAVTATAPTVTAVVSVPTEDSGLAIPGWVLIGSGGAMVVGGIVATIMAAGTQQEMTELTGKMKDIGNPDQSEPHKALLKEYNDLEEDLEVDNMLIGVMYGVGAAAGVVGLVLIMLDSVGDLPNQEAPAATFSLTPTQGGAFGQATLRF